MTATKPPTEIDPTGTRRQAFFREMNERIEELLSSGMYVEFACECAATTCAAPIVLSVEEYEAIRRFPTRFLVAPGHIALTNERVVEQNERFAVVEKTGEGGSVAVLLDPRRKLRREPGRPEQN
jgi:hypothetical protein